MRVVRCAVAAASLLTGRYASGQDVLPDSAAASARRAPSAPIIEESIGAGRYRLPWVPDGARPGRPMGRWRSPGLRLTVSVGVPTLLIGYGALSRHERIAGVLDSRYDTHNEIQEHYAGFRTRIDDYTRHVPTAAVFGLSLAGVPARHAAPDRAILFAASNLLGTGITSYLKHEVADGRPYDSTVRSSFPSYHTTQAFIGATVLAEEYGGRPGGIWIAAGGYAVAAGTGVLRLLNNRHWSSDVLAGAGIGILSTELVYAVYPVVRRAVLGGRRRPVRGLVAPTLPTRGSGFGVVGVWLLR